MKVYYAAGVPYSDELYHFGRKGQKWGVRNGPPYPLDISQKEYSGGNKNTPVAYKNIKDAKVSNLDKWGKDADHNILYVAGRSGSGKSSTALGLKKPGDTVIHLDAFSDAGLNDKSWNKHRDKRFVDFLDKNVPNWKQLSDHDFSSSDYWKLVDNFRESIEAYSRQQFEKGKRVILEGVQIGDEWLTDDKNYYSGKPMVILTTDAKTSLQRAIGRDGPMNKEHVENYLKQSKIFDKRLDELARNTGSSVDVKAIEKFMAQYY